MSLREALRREPDLLRVNRTVSRRLELAGLLHALGARPALFASVAESPFAVAGNLFAGKEAVARHLAVEPRGLIARIVEAIDRPVRPEVVERAPCQEVVEERVDLGRLPLLVHCEQDGGPYISAGVVVARHPVHGQNLDFHRMMQIGEDRLAVRVVAGRHFDLYLRETRRMPIAVCLGNGANVMLAAATSVGLGQDELEIAAALEPLRVVRAHTFDALIPADCEVVLEGVIDIEDRADEGPFVDLTGTYDRVRLEPVLTVQTITHRADAIWQALLPGGLEHRVMMGMPREPTILRAVTEAGVRCLDVHINPGGCSWLHAIVQIDKQREDDGRRAIDAAFRGHRSLKHAFVVDEDIDIYDPQAVEWAMATRFQGDRDLRVFGREPGSSLDPSADGEQSVTCKVGFDLTRPLTAGGKSFARATFPRTGVRLDEILGADARRRR
jgi:2,5-furandicarboxylate decarboxylase 1